LFRLRKAAVPPELCVISPALVGDSTNKGRNSEYTAGYCHPSRRLKTAVILPISIPINLLLISAALTFKRKFNQSV